MSGILDLFAGPGGWSEGLRMLGWSELGIEWDDAACATARAAGHERLQADVAELEPMAFGPCWGLIASPPCQAFSMAGKGAARRALPTYAEAVGQMARGELVDRDALDQACGDPRGHLVLEPLRWALEIRPEWIALEQVRPVLPLWGVIADALRQDGYSAWTGILEAERYGVPQTRERAILMAQRCRPIHPPAPTHQRFVSGEPARHEHTLAGEVLPWVSMAEALGWRAGQGVVETGNFSAVARDADGRRSRSGSVRYSRSADSPAPVVTGNFDRWKLRAGTNANDCARSADAPAPTLRFGARSNDVSWVHDRPATTVNCDPRIAQPGHKGDVGKEPGAIRQMQGAVRVTVQEATILQSFRPDYPWQGSRTKQFEQVGNAVPPLLAVAVLRELAGDAMQKEAA